MEQIVKRTLILASLLLLSSFVAFPQTNAEYVILRIEGNNQINPYKEKGYIITPGSSVVKFIDDNPYKKQPEQKEYKITPQESINPNIKYNPYKNNGKIETPQGPNKYIIPNQSINQVNQNIINPYNNNKNQVNQNIINPYNINTKNQNYGRKKN